MVRKKPHLRYAIAVFLALCVLMVYVTAVLTPERKGYGALWENYREEPENSVDVLFLGNSIIYSDIIPGIIYDKTGIAAYSVTAQSMTMPEMYYYVREALKTQTPEYLFLELSAMFTERDPSFDFQAISYMPNNLNKVCAAFESVPLKESLNCLLPVYQYHSRWKDISASDLLRPFRKSGPDKLAGYTFLCESQSYPETEPKDEICSADHYAKAEGYLLKTLRYCEERSIPVIAFLSPRRNTYREENIEALRKTLSDAGVTFIDFDCSADEIGLLPDKDYYDRSHLNWYGALRFTKYLSRYLTEDLGLSASENIDTELWNSRVLYLSKYDYRSEKEQ